MLCSFLLYGKVNQLYVYIYALFFFFDFHPVTVFKLALQEILMHGSLTITSDACIPPAVDVFSSWNWSCSLVLPFFTWTLL